MKERERLERDDGGEEGGKYGKKKKKKKIISCKFSFASWFEIFRVEEQTMRLKWRYLLANDAFAICLGCCCFCYYIVCGMFRRGFLYSFLFSLFSSFFSVVMFSAIPLLINGHSLYHLGAFYWNWPKEDFIFKINIAWKLIKLYWELRMKRIFKNFDIDI